MEQGVIHSALAEGTGRIKPGAGGDLVFFTDAEFNLPWSQATVGRPVRFTRAPGTTMATSVVAQ